MSLIVRPVMPYNGPIHGGMHDGKRIEISGSVPHGADVFTVNLTTGLDSHSDRPLHVSVRFHGRVVVRNSYMRGGWGREERDGPFPFVQGGNFLISIVVNQLNYNISVNGSFCWKFNHRLPMSRVTNLMIDGRVSIDRIQSIDVQQPTFVRQPSVVYPVSPPPSIYNPPTYVVLPSNPPGTCYIPPPQNPYPYPSGGLNLQPVYNPPIPFTYIIPGGLRPGLMIYISARPSLFFPNDWMINLRESGNPQQSDICFHMGVRHHSSSVVRNTRLQGRWEWEETSLGRSFPFEAAKDFQLLLRVEADRFMVALDNQHLFEFRHRLQPLSRFDTLCIENDIHVYSVTFS